MSCVDNSEGCKQDKRKGKKEKQEIDLLELEPKKKDFFFPFHFSGFYSF